MFLFYCFSFFTHLFWGISQSKYYKENLLKYYMGSGKKIKIPLSREKKVSVYVVKQNEGIYKLEEKSIR